MHDETVWWLIIWPAVHALALVGWDGSVKDEDGDGDGDSGLLFCLIVLGIEISL